MYLVEVLRQAYSAVKSFYLANKLARLVLEVQMMAAVVFAAMVSAMGTEIVAVGVLLVVMVSVVVTSVVVGIGIVPVEVLVVSMSAMVKPVVAVCMDT